MWDGIIVGGGLAGLLAGIRASERGRRILIISSGTGSLMYSSGVVDIGDVGKLKSRPNHPYAVLGDAVLQTGIAYFQALFPAYQGKWGAAQEVLTPLGIPRRAGLVPYGLNALILRDAKLIILVAPEGLKDFFPEVVRANLEKSYPHCAVKIYPLRLPEFETWRVLGKPVNAIDYAKYWRSSAGIENFKHTLNSLSQELVCTGKSSGIIENQAAVIFPGLAAGFSHTLRDLLVGAPFPVVEMTAFPPSANGQALYEALKDKFSALGGELLVGAAVNDAEIEGGNCQKVMVNSKGRNSVFSARSYILASGGIFGGGIEVTPGKGRETAFGLPLYVPDKWSQAEFLGEQPYAQMGIEVDPELRPLDPRSRNVLLENVRVIGRTLAHWDPWSEHCGGGVSLAAGWFAGEKI